MFGEQDVDGDEVVADVRGVEDVLLLPDIVFLLCHVPVELPQLARLLQPRATLQGQLHQLGIRVLMMMMKRARDVRVNLLMMLTKRARGCEISYHSSAYAS